MSVNNGLSIGRKGRKTETGLAALVRIAANLERTVCSIRIVDNPQMQGIPGSTIALGSPLLIAACLKEDRE